MTSSTVVLPEPEGPNSPSRPSAPVHFRSSAKLPCRTARSSDAGPAPAAHAASRLRRFDTHTATSAMPSEATSSIVASASRPVSR